MTEEATYELTHDDRADDHTVLSPDTEAAPRSDEETFRQGNAYLIGKLKLPENEPPANVFQCFLNGEATRPLIEAERGTHLEAFENFYAGVQMMESAPNRDDFIQMVCEAVGIERRRKNTNEITLIARHLMAYRQKDDSGKLDPEERRRWHRDAQGARLLRHEGVPVGGVAKYQEENGGGPETWAKKWSEITKASKQKPPVNEEAPPPDSTMGSDSSISQVADKLLGELKEGESAVLLVTRLDGVLACQDYARVQSDFQDRSTWKTIKHQAPAGLSDVSLQPEATE